MSRPQRSLSRRISDIVATIVFIPIILILVIVGAFFSILFAPFWLPWMIHRRTSGHPLHWLRAKFGWGKNINKLAKRLGVSVDELVSFFPQYHETFIPKRSGGLRQLLIPDAQTKQLQQRILKRLLRKLSAHRCATGFEAGKSIVDNALPHVGQAVVIKLDIVDFFPNTTADRVEKYFRRIGWNKEAAQLIVKLTTHNGGLPQGAPTSPRLSNLLNYLLDDKLLQVAQRRRGNYTRYADDITFSFPEDWPKKMRGVVQATQRVVKRFGYKLNSDKTRILRPHQRQTVTGLNVNTKVSLSRHVRRKLRAARHQQTLGQSTTWTCQQLVGWAALEAMIEQQSGKIDRQSDSP